MNSIGILVVEDDHSIALGIEMMITEFGYQYLGNPRTSEQALKAIALKKPDLIIMDIAISGSVDGITLAQAEIIKEIPLIYITGLKDASYFERAQQTTYTAYLVKPFHMLTLRSAIEKALETTQNTPFKNEEEKGLLLKSNNTFHQISLNDIQYVEVDGNYCYFYTAEKKIAKKLSLKRVLQQINQQNKFLKIHRKYVIHKNFVNNFNVKDSTIHMNGIDIPVGRHFKEHVMTVLREKPN